jgi:hypothetical protein
VIVRDVISLTFRFGIDGRTWRDRWNSNDAPSERIPVVVETTLRLREHDGDEVELISAVYLPMGGRRG